MTIGMKLTTYKHNSKARFLSLQNQAITNDEFFFGENYLFENTGFNKLLEESEFTLLNADSKMKQLVEPTKKSHNFPQSW